MGEKKKRQNDAAELDALYRQIEHAKNEDIAIKAIEIARYWLIKAYRQTVQIQNLERRNRVLLQGGIGMSLISKQVDELRFYAADRKGELAKLISDAADIIEMLSAKARPSVQQEKHTENAQKAHACDLISRQAAIDTLDVGAELLRRVLDDADITLGVEREKYAWGLGLIESYISDMEELPSAQPERQINLDGFETPIEILSALRSQFNCFDEQEEKAYHALSEAIHALSAQQKPLKYTGESICVYCRTTNCKGCMYEPMSTIGE